MTVKRYIRLKNHVQLIGFRGQIELLGRDLGLKGVVFNFRDGSVRVIAEGVKEQMDIFLNDLKHIREGTTIETHSIQMDHELPEPFSSVATDDKAEDRKRFDRGIELLTGIKEDLKILTDIREDTGFLVEGQKNLIEGQKTMVETQKTMIETQKTMIGTQKQTLETLKKIAKKL